jgi:hypothetical protein
MRKRNLELNVLVPDGDHSYRLTNIVRKQVVWHEPSKTWSEYAGDEHLGDDEQVVWAHVVE